MSLEKQLFRLLLFRPKLLYFCYRTKLKKAGKKAMEVNHNKSFPFHSNLRKNALFKQRSLYVKTFEWEEILSIALSK